MKKFNGVVASVQDCCIGQGLNLTYVSCIIQVSGRTCLSHKYKYTSQRSILRTPAKTLNLIVNDRWSSLLRCTSYYLSSLYSK